MLDLDDGFSYFRSIRELESYEKRVIKQDNPDATFCDACPTCGATLLPESEGYYSCGECDYIRIPEDA